MRDETTVAVPARDEIPAPLLAYRRRVLEGLEQAQREMEQARQLDQQAGQLRQSATARMGAFESCEAHLFELLGLDPRADRIEDDGRVVRASSPAGPPVNGKA